MKKSLVACAAYLSFSAVLSSSAAEPTNTSSLSTRAATYAAPTEFTAPSMNQAAPNKNQATPIAAYSAPVQDAPVMAPADSKPASPMPTVQAQPTVQAPPTLQAQPAYPGADPVVSTPTHTFTPSDPSCEPACEPVLEHLEQKRCDATYYGSIEALFFWVKDAPVAPLITTNPNPNTIASLQQPGTTVLFGGAGQSIDFGSTTGVRGTLGAWLYENTVGVEGTIFGLPQQGITYNAVSGGGNGPVIAVPFDSTVKLPYTPSTPGETTLNPGNTPSSIRVTATTELWGAEALGTYNIYRTTHSYATMLAGFRYLDLREKVGVDQLFLDPNAAGLITVGDAFTSRNQFYGAEVGVHSGFNWGIFGIEATGKVALGPNQESYSDEGATTLIGKPFGLASGAIPAGILSLPSNAGTFHRNEFVAIPEGELRVNVDVFHNVRIFAGYDFLYMNDAVRASSEINHNINPTQATTFLTPSGVPAPLPGFKNTSYWAEGITAGIKLSF